MTSVSKRASQSLGSSRQRSTAAAKSCGAPGRPSSHANVVSSGAIMPGAAAALDRHVADGHAALHRERPDRRPGVLDDVALRAGDADLADRAEDDVLRADADAERRRRRVMRIVCGIAWVSVWVARTCSTSLVPMPNARAPNAPCVEVWLSPHTIVMPGWVTPSSGPMMWTIPCRAAADGEQRDAELLGVALQGLDLRLRERVGDALLAPDGGDVVVDRREGAVGAADRAAGEPEAVERLRRGDLVDQVEVDEQDRRPVGAGRRGRRGRPTPSGTGSCPSHTPPATRSPCSACRLALTALT